MKVLSPTSNEINVLHFNGRSQYNHNSLFSDCMNVNLEKTDNFEIISCWDRDDKCILNKQLSKNNISLKNSYIKTDKRWDNRYKIECFLNALKESNSDIIMLLDGNDVLFTDFSNIIDKFKNYNTKILFQAGTYDYPISGIEEIRTIPGSFGFEHLCAGCCIGYKDYLIEFYGKCFEIKDTLKNIWKSEQLVVRTAYKYFTEKYGYGYSNIDYNVSIFQKMYDMKSVFEDGVYKVTFK